MTAASQRTDFADLSIECLETICAHADADDIFRLASCSKLCRDAASSEATQRVVASKLMRRAQRMLDSKYSSRVHRSSEYLAEMKYQLRLLAARENGFEIVMGFETDADVAASKEQLRERNHVPVLDVEFMDEVYQGFAQLCFGLRLCVDDLERALYVGRRWYSNPRERLSGYDLPRSRDDSFALISQPVCDQPYEGEACYTEVRTEHDLQRRTAGSNGAPDLSRYYLSTAVMDLVERAGLGGSCSGIGMTRTGEPRPSRSPHRPSSQGVCGAGLRSLRLARAASPISARSVATRRRRTGHGH